MAELRTALEDSLSGRGRLVMLAGEPGIGKTRIARELAAVAESRGAQLLWGRSYEEEGAPPYWPWVQPLRAYVQQQDPEQLLSAMGPGAADIAEIIPNLRSKLPDLKPSPTLEPEQARFRLFDSITTFLKNVASSQPLMLVLDDLHWADRPSLLLLQFLARQMAESCLLVVGTYRDVEVSLHDPLTETLGNLIREEHFQRIQLAGLSAEEVGQYVQDSGVASPPGMVQAVHQRTEGNPLFMGEVVRLLAQEGPGTEGQWSLSIPEGIREVIGKRLGRLSQECNESLTIASVMGREFQLAPLVQMSDLPAESVLIALEEGLAARLIEEAPGNPEGYQFSHALIQETLTAELSAARRVRLHARIAETVEGLYGAAAGTHAAELAYHFARAESVLGAEKLVGYSLLAGEQALAAYAWDEALGYFERALVARGFDLAGTEPAKDDETAALLFGLARAQANTLARHRLNEVWGTINSTFDYYVAAGDILGALTIAEYPFTRLPGSAGTTRLLAEALKLVPPDSHQAGRLMARYAAAHSSEFGDYEDVMKTLDQAMTIAQREKDRTLEMDVLTTMANTQFWELRYQESLENSLRAIELGRKSGQLFAGEANADWYAHRTLIPMGDPVRAGSHAAAYLAMAERHRNRFHLARALDAQGVLAFLEGHWETAREFSDRGLSIDERDSRLLYHRAILEYEVGEFSQGDAYSERLVDTMGLSPTNTTPYQLVPMAIGLAAHITGTERRFGVAEEAAQAMLSLPGILPFYAQLARTGLALLAVVRGDVAAAREQYESLTRWPVTLTSQNPTCGHRVLGLLAHTMGNMNQAVSHFEDSLAFCRQAGYRPELAWTCHDYADTLLKRNDRGDRQKATTLLNESLAISTELGMRPLVERVAALQERPESQSAKAPAYPDGLTQREVEVLQLIAAGKTDREIADELYISVRTVGYHVGNILNKTTTTNRTEAATYASRIGLV